MLEKFTADEAQVLEKLERKQSQLSDLEDADLDLLKTELRRLLGERRAIVTKLQAGLQRSFKNIQRIEFIEQQIASKAREEAQFLDEHLLWIRSAKSIGVQDLKSLVPALKWLFSPIHWWQTGQKLMQSVMHHPIVCIPGLLIPIIFIFLRRRARRSLADIAKNVYSVKTDSFVLTLQALALTFRAAFGWPLLLGFAGRLLTRYSPSEVFAFAAGKGLTSAALALAGSLFLYEMCAKVGIAKVHFKWLESVRRAMQSSLRWFVPILVCMTFIFTAVQTRNNVAFNDSLGRLGLTILMLSLAGWAAYVLRFSGEIVSMLKLRSRNSWLVRLRFIWYPLTIGVPLLLIVLAAMGYYYSVYALYIRIGETIVFFLGLIIVQNLVLRWFSIVQRRLVFEEIKRKKEIRDQQQEHEALPADIEADTVQIEEPEINLAQIYEKNQVLLRTITFFTALIGLWLVWADVLPALGFLEDG